MTQQTRQRREKKGEILVRCAHTEVWDLPRFRPNPANPNEHPKDQIRLLAHIIKKNGWRNAIVVSKRSGLIVKGHARFQAAKLLGSKTAPVDLQDYDSDEQEMQDLVADNRIAELAEMNEELLVKMLLELQTRGADMTLAGYDAEELADLLNSTPEAIDEVLAVERVKIEWGKFKVFHCTVGEQIYCLDRANYLVSFGTMEGKVPARPKPDHATVFIDSGMLTLARRIGKQAIKQQKQVVDYAERCRGDWVAMMDIPQVEPVLESLKLTRAAAYKIHLANGREFAEIPTRLRKVYVMQGQGLADYDRCCGEMKPLVGKNDVVAIGSIKDRADNAKLVSAITAKVHKHFPKNDIHLFGVTTPVTVRESIQYGATSCDSAVAGNATRFGEFLFAKRRNETDFAIESEPLGKLMGVEGLSIDSKLWVALSAFSMAQVEATMCFSMAMLEAGLNLNAGHMTKTRKRNSQEEKE